MRKSDAWTKATFYVAALLVEVSVDASDEKLFYEERFLFVTADSEQEATEKAIQYASDPVTYKNQYGEAVTWSFKELVSVKPLVKDEVRDGTELFSRFFQSYETYDSLFIHPPTEERS